MVPHGILAYLRQLATPSPLAALPDAALLDLFARQADEAAFAELMVRHGPMVLAVCQRLLASPQDAEDAFQGTFLVLAKRAGQVRRPDRLSPWLYGVARKVAGKLRARRRAAPLAADVAAPEPPDRELEEAIEEEVAQLPPRYREALVLCCLEGLSREAAAERLGETPGVLKGLLERARERLGARLARRGVLPAVPAGLAAATMRAVSGGAVSPGVNEVVLGVLADMNWNGWKVAGVLGLVAVVCLAFSLSVRTAPVPAPEEAGPDKATAEKAKREQTIQPGDYLQIKVTNALPEQPIDGVFRVEPSGKVPLGPGYGRVGVADLTPERAEEALSDVLRDNLKPGYKVMLTWADSPPDAGALHRRIDDLEKKLRSLEATVERLRQKVK